MTLQEMYKRAFVTVFKVTPKRLPKNKFFTDLTEKFKSITDWEEFFVINMQQNKFNYKYYLLLTEHAYNSYQLYFDTKIVKDTYVKSVTDNNEYRERLVKQAKDSRE